MAFRKRKVEFADRKLMLNFEFSDWRFHWELNWSEGQISDLSFYNFLYDRRQRRETNCLSTWWEYFDVIKIVQSGKSLERNSRRLFFIIVVFDFVRLTLIEIKCDEMNAFQSWRDLNVFRTQFPFYYYII